MSFSEQSFSSFVTYTGLEFSKSLNSDSLLVNYSFFISFLLCFIIDNLSYTLHYFILQIFYFGGWGDSLAARSVHCSCEGFDFSSHLPYQVAHDCQHSICKESEALFYSLLIYKPIHTYMYIVLKKLKSF